MIGYQNQVIGAVRRVIGAAQGLRCLAAYPDMFSDTREVYDRARECF